jgi:hypothetical protein
MSSQRASSWSTRRVSTSGVIAASYRRVGEVQTGSFAFEEPTERELERRETMKAYESPT